jgi:hypothetical protein
MFALISLGSKNKSMSCILTHVPLINKLLTAKVAGPDHTWPLFSQ